MRVVALSVYLHRSYLPPWLYYDWPKRCAEGYFSSVPPGAASLSGELSHWLPLASLSPSHPPQRARGMLINTCLFLHLTQHHPSNLHVRGTLPCLREGRGAVVVQKHALNRHQGMYCSHSLPTCSNNDLITGVRHVNAPDCLTSGDAVYVLGRAEI